MKVAYFKCHEVPQMLEIKGETQEIEKIVGGAISTYHIGDGLVIMCDALRQVKNKPSNRFVKTSDNKPFALICGDFIICKADFKNYRYINIDENDKKEIVKLLNLSEGALNELNQ